MGGAKDLITNLLRMKPEDRFTAEQAALQIMAKQLTEDQLKQLRDVFQSLDVNQDGCLTIQEMRDGLARSNISDVPADLQQIMEHIDSDGSGEIEYNEFLAACLDRRLYMKEDVCWSAFRVFDRNGDGKISKEELRQVLHDSSVQEVAGTAAASIEVLMNDVDRNGDGEIDFQEFFAMMKEKN